METTRPRPSSVIEFPPFQLDLRAGLLRRGNTPLNLRPKTFAVLQHLAERPGELVTKQELLDAVWAGVAVTEDVVRLSVREIRVALGDERAAARFIETIPRRGYRFTAGLVPATTSRREVEPSAGSSARGDGTVVGRVRERSLIDDWLRLARSGRRQVAFVSGEAGIGKTTLVDSVLRDLRRSDGTARRIARGQCIEHFGGGEPYLPVLDALADLCRGSGAQPVRAVLAEHAPEWVLSALGAATSGVHTSTATIATTHEHTLHKLAASVDALAAEVPLVLVLEDVQWSDYATLDLISMLAQRREPAHLLVLVTVRPTDAIVRGHPVAGVKRELVRKGLCKEILLDGLSAADVAAYLTARLDGADPPEDLLRLLVDRTEGNPFFVVTLVEHLIEHELLVRAAERWELRGSVDELGTAIPEGLRAVIEPRLDRLSSDELRVLEVASAVGLEFPAHAVARTAPADGDLGDVEVVEQLCDGLVRRQEILRPSGEGIWPDGTTSARYAFRHALYQQVVYQRLRSSARRRLHQEIGESLETAYGGGAMDVASELAAHFERSRDVERAIRYRGGAAVHAGSRFAYQETRLHLQAALALLGSLPEDAERQRQEMPLLHQLGWTLTTMSGWGDEDARLAFARMQTIAQRLDDPLMRLRAMESLRALHAVRAEYEAARSLSLQTMALATELGDKASVASAHNDLAVALFWLGDLEAACGHAEQARSSGQDAGIYSVACRVMLATMSAHRGSIARSYAMLDEALACAAEIGVPYVSAFAKANGAGSCKELRDIERARAVAREAIQLSSEFGLSDSRSKAAMILGWCDVQEGCPEQGRDAIHAAFLQLAASGERAATTTWQSVLAEAHLACSDVTSASEVLDAAFAFAAETGERSYEPELHRLRGECALAGAASRSEKSRAAEHFEKAAAIAAEIGTTLFELRATTSLFRIRKTTRERLVRLIERFDAENDCADARVARSLLGA